MIYLIGYVIGFVSALLISSNSLRDGVSYIIGFIMGTLTFFILQGCTG